MIDRAKGAKFPAAANFAALTPISFLTRTAAVYADLPAVVYGAQRRTWAETSARCLQLASALRGAGLNRKETVSIIADNILDRDFQADRPNQKGWLYVAVVLDLFSRRVVG